MKSVSATCWRCGEEQTEILLPLSRTEVCGACSADLHVCRMCRFYDTSVGNACREPVADHVADKTRANFCGYLELRNDAGTYAQNGNLANDDLKALFGLDPTDQDSGPATLDDLFGNDQEDDS